MTTTLKWQTVQSWIECNPFQTTALKPYTKSNETIEGVNDIVESTNWIRTPVSPSTPLSAILIAQDSLYSASPINARRSILRDEVTDLQEKALLHLKGRQWPVRKTSEGISASGEEGRASTWTTHGWRAICALRECQIIVINEEKKNIQFYPEDIRNWSSDIDIIFIEYEARCIWNGVKISNLGIWLSEHEQNGWTIEWPLADGTMEELKLSAEKLNEILSSKPNKETLRKRIGRSESIKTLSLWI